MSESKRIFFITLCELKLIAMQYTAKTPHNSVLILQPEGLRYRFQEDHLFKDIRYSQITGVKVKRNLFIHYINFFIPPFVFITQLYSIFTDGLNWSNGLMV